MLKIKMLKEEVKVPMRGTIGSAGNDIFAHEDIVIPSKHVVKIELPFTFEGKLEKYDVTVYVRSSFGIKKKQRIVENDKKTIHGKLLKIEEGKLSIELLNDSDEEIEIKKDEHFAQFVITLKNAKKEKQSLEWLTEEELGKNGKVKTSIEVVEPNVYNIIIEEDIVFDKGEQKTLSTGIRSVIEQNTYTAIDIHNEVKNSLMLANQRGIVDYDYAYNEGTKGNCFLGVLNISEEGFVLKKGTRLATFFTEKYETLENEIEITRIRTSGVGHTSENK